MADMNVTIVLYFNTYVFFLMISHMQSHKINDNAKMQMQHPPNIFGYLNEARLLQLLCPYIQ